ncbi:MAG: HlyD family efflux transporter periplasmic adaptor subunit [Pseudomonadota bacterium]
MSSDLFRKEALDYQSASGARWGAPTGVLPPSWSRITLLLAVFMGALLAFLFNVDFARKETVRGKLRVDGAEAKIYALEPGLISQVFVEDGQLVANGDPIAEIRSDRFMVSGGALSEATLAALETEKETLVARKNALVTSADLNRKDTEQRLEDAIRKEGEARAQYEVAQGRLGIARKRATDAEEFLAEGLIAEPQLNERLDAVAVLEQSVLQVEAQIGDAVSAQSRNRLEIDQVKAGLARDLTDISQRLSQIDAQMQRTESETTHMLRAPIAGRVTALQARYGEQAISGMPLAIVLPENSELVAEIYIPSRAIGFVEPGQQVKLQYDAFPYQKFGIAYGEVAVVASTAQLPQEIGIPSQTNEPVYRVGISLDAQSVEAFSRQMPLQAGMELTADVVLENRRLLEWLLEPLMSKK